MPMNWSRRAAHEIFDQIGSGVCQGISGNWQAGVAGLFPSQEPTQVHPTAVVHDFGVAGISQDRFSRHHRDLERVVGPAGVIGSQDCASLFEPLLCRETAAKKNGFELLLAASVKRAHRLQQLHKSAAIDSTGYEAGHTSEYYGRRAGLKKSRFPKMTAIADTKSHFYLSGVPRRGPLPDDKEFEPAITKAYSLHRFTEILADAGYDAERHHILARDKLKVRSIIPPTRGRPTKKPPTGRYRRQMAKRFPKKRFGQRWQIESCFSQDKRRFGSSIEARTYWSQCRALNLRVLVHNLALPGSLCNLFNRAGHSGLLRRHAIR
jgi:hypothetical protein